MKVLSLLPKMCRVIKGDSKVLDLPELEIVKLSDTRWLTHERVSKQ